MMRMHVLVLLVLATCVGAEQLCSTGLGDAEDAGDSEASDDLDDSSFIQTMASYVMMAHVQQPNATAHDSEHVVLLGKSHKAAVNTPTVWVVPPNDPTDWLFGVRTTVCDENVTFDNNTSTLTSSIFIVSLLMTCVYLVLQLGRASAAAGDALDLKGGSVSSEPASQSHAQSSPSSSSSQWRRPDDSGSSSSKPAERVWHLDFARIVAVMCVIFEHCGGEGYTRRNIGFGLWWALPYLYMTSGMACMMSRSSMLGYICRLMCVFLIGTGANWIADVISNYAYNTNRNFWNTMFQMMFVLMLMGMALITEQLRQALVFRKKHPHDKATAGMVVSTVVCGIVLGVSLLRYLVHYPFQFNLGGDFGEYYQSFTMHYPLLLVQSVGTLFLCHLACLYDCSRTSGWVGWLLVAFIYLPSVVVPWQQDAFPRFLSLYVVGMTSMVWPLKGQETIAKATWSYWPMLTMILCLLSQPNMIGRCDMYPPAFMWERFRHRAGECILAICFLTASFQCSDPWNIVATMNYWSLFAYTFHVAFYRLLDSPNGAALTFAFIPVFFLIAHCVKQPAGEKAPKSGSG